MARLTIQQTQAPNFSASGQMLANAGRAFNEGLTAAGDLLGKYQEGREAVGDQALAAELASHRNAADFDAFVAKGGLNNLNISDVARADLLANRGRIADVAGTQASTLLTGAQTGLVGQQTISNRDVNNFRNSENADMVAARNEQRSLAAGYQAAASEARARGQGQTGNYQNDDRELLARTLQAEAGGEGAAGMLAAGAVIRNRAASGKYGKGIRGVILRPGQISAWNGLTGYLDGEGSIDMDRLAVTDEAYAAADQLLSGNYEDPTGGATHYYNDAVADPAWGQSKAGGEWRRVGNHLFGFGDGDPGSISRASGPVEGYGTGAQDAYNAQLAATQYMNPSQIEAAQNQVTTARNQGDARIAALEAARVDALGAESILAAAQNPENINAGQVGVELLNTQALTPAQRIALSGQGQGLADTTLQSVVSPYAPADPLTSARVDALRATNEQQLAANDQTRLVEGAKAMESNPTAGLVGATGINSDGEGSYSDQQVSSMINEIAKNNNITPGQAAMAMSENLVVNPGKGEDGGWIPGDFTRNTLERRFPLDRVEKFIKDNFSEEAQATYRGEEQRLRVAGADLSAQELRLSNLRTQAAKYPAGEVPEGITAQISQIRDQLAENKSPRELQNDLQTYLQQTGTMSRLAGVEPGSDEFIRVMRQIEINMMADPSLGENEKRLLIGALRG